ncbi:MAG: hypothetical protein WCQ89_20040, partial [Verrucomicrobiota bacterium]
MATGLAGTLLTTRLTAGLPTGTALAALLASAWLTTLTGGASGPATTRRRHLLQTTFARANNSVRVLPSAFARAIAGLARLSVFAAFPAFPALAAGAVGSALAGTVTTKPGQLFSGAKSVLTACPRALPVLTGAVTGACLPVFPATIA